MGVHLYNFSVYDVWVDGWEGYFADWAKDDRGALGPGSSRIGAAWESAGWWGAAMARADVPGLGLIEIGLLGSAFLVDSGAVWDGVHVLDVHVHSAINKICLRLAVEGDALFVAGAYATAREKYNKAASCTKDENNRKIYEAKALRAEGHILRDKKDYNGAIAKYRQANGSHDFAGYHHDLASVLSLQGDALLDQKNYSATIDRDERK